MSDELKFRYEKIVQSGGLIETYEYERVPNPPKYIRRKKKSKWDGAPKYKSERHVKRAVFTFKRKTRATLVYGAPHMFTFTMWEIVDIETAYKLFTEFGTRLKKLYGKKIIWITVPEFQKRGAVHFHTLIWNLKHDIHETERNDRAIQHLWGYGFVDVIASDGSPKISSYMAKYMSKAMSDARLFGKKAYSCTRNTLSPVSLKTQTSVALFKNLFKIGKPSGPQPTNDSIYETKWLGKARYRSYDIDIKTELT